MQSHERVTRRGRTLRLVPLLVVLALAGCQAPGELDPDPWPFQHPAGFQHPALGENPTCWKVILAIEAKAREALADPQTPPEVSGEVRTVLECLVWSASHDRVPQDKLELHRSNLEKAWNFLHPAEPGTPPNWAECARILQGEKIEYMAGG